MTGVGRLWGNGEEIVEDVFCDFVFFGLGDLGHCRIGTFFFNYPCILYGMIKYKRKQTIVGLC